MLPLRQLQLDFTQAIFGEMSTGLANSIQGDGLGAGPRLEIYRNNVFTNLREALRAVYPVIDRLVGEAFFNYAADAFIHTHASASGDVEDYGVQFDVFLANFPAAQGLAYLPDVARLEWACHQAFYAADQASLSIKGLADIPPEQFKQLRFRMNPASALLASGYPVQRIWEVNQPGFAGDQGVDLALGGVKLLIIRRGFQIELQALGAGEFSMLESLAAGCTVAEAYDQAERVEPEFDFMLFLKRHLSGGTMVSFYGKEPCH
ncbi:MAG: DNA-binding domain-containing protein [Sulfuricella sp.]|jgi:hypothetical protein